MKTMTDRNQTAFRQRRSRARDWVRRSWNPGHSEQGDLDPPDDNAVVHCGWGRLLFGHTFDSAETLTEAIRAEAADERDIAVYLNDPHVLLAQAPEALFLDPSHTFRLDFQRYRPRRDRVPGLFVRRVRSSDDAAAVNQIYAKCGMIQVSRAFFLNHRVSRRIVHLVAIDEASGAVVGTVTGIDHALSFGDPERGSSLWCLAVDPQASLPGIGEVLVRHLIETFQTRGLAQIDLSVMHDNEQAIALNEKLGFERVPLFSVKYKNPINEKLYSAPAPEAQLNPYARIIINEARRRGIGVEIEDEDAGLFTLVHGGRRVACRESLSELTSAVAFSRCDDKAITSRLLKRQGFRVPEQREVTDDEDDEAFLETYGRIVVKPAKGEQGRGIAVDISDVDDMRRAIDAAYGVSDRVLLEEFCTGDDLRLIVIDHKLVAAAIRKPASLVGDGTSTVRTLIEKQSRRRAAATGGESRIPVDAETERCISLAGYGYDSVLPAGQHLAVRKTANLHTGGTIHDVTPILSPRLALAAEEASRALSIPLVGFDFLVPDPAADDYVIVEANERPGLANHEPQPTAERFVDMLFPHTIDRAARPGGQRMTEETRHAAAR
jgi:GNAT-family acetyltransferase (TIGR03103 family)